MAASKPKRPPKPQVELNVPIETLNFYPGNPRRGDIEVIKRLMKRRGWWGAVVCQVNGRNVLAGNHRLLARRELAEQLALDPGVAEAEAWHPNAAGWDAPTVDWQDVNDDEAAVIVAGDNRASDMAFNDPFDTHALLTRLNEDQLLSLSYGATDLEQLLAQITPPTLDGLTEEHGEYDEADRRSFWPRMVLQMSPDTLARFNALRLATVGQDEHDEEFVLAILERCGDVVQA